MRRLRHRPLHTSPNRVTRLGGERRGPYRCRAGDRHDLSGGRAAATSALAATRVTNRRPCKSGRLRSGRRQRLRLPRTGCGLVRPLWRGLDTPRHRRCRGRCGRGRRRDLLGAADRRRRNVALRQEEQRIEIAMWVVAATHAEMDVWNVHLCRTARADRPDRGSLRNRVSSMHRLGAEVQQRHRVTALALDRHGPAAAGNCSGE